MGAISFLRTEISENFSFMKDTCQQKCLENSMKFQTVLDDLRTEIYSRPSIIPHNSVEDYIKCSEWHNICRRLDMLEHQLPEFFTEMRCREDAALVQVRAAERGM